MKRRHFLFALAGSSAVRALPPKPVRINRILLTPIEGQFHKFVAMNSYDKAPKGRTYTNSLIRILTDQGAEGIGVTGYSAGGEFHADMRKLIGADPMALYEMRDGRIVGRSPVYAPLLDKYRYLDAVLYDLVGKLTGKPCWKLIGDSARDRVEAYDGTLYFSDIWFKDRGISAVVAEAEEAVRSGYAGIKLKIGRGWKWMEKEAGLRRDIDVLKATRKAVGPNVKILADANNGYRDDFDRAWKLMSETRDVHLHWIEEIFPENVEWYTRLRRRMAEAGIEALIAEGESVQNPGDFEPYLKPKRLIDVLQMDIRRGGFLANREMAALGEAAGAISVPHNWGSHLGLLMGLHLSKATPSVPAAEDDRSAYDTIVTEGYRFEGGYYTVPTLPGLGIRINGEVYKEKYQNKEVVIA